MRGVLGGWQGGPARPHEKTIVRQKGGTGEKGGRWGKAAKPGRGREGATARVGPSPFPRRAMPTATTVISRQSSVGRQGWLPLGLTTDDWRLTTTCRLPAC